jgi:hypothetical protein
MPLYYSYISRILSAMEQMKSDRGYMRNNAKNGIEMAKQLADELIPFIESFTNQN